MNLLAGDYPEALKISNEMLGGPDGNLLPRDSADSSGPQDAAAANNAAVILLLAGAGETSAESGKASPSSGFASAQELSRDRNASGGGSHETPDPRIALARYNLGMAALQDARFAQAETILTESLAEWRRAKNHSTPACVAINLNSLAQLDLVEGQSARAESRAKEAAELFTAANADDLSAFAYQSTLAQIDASKSHFTQAIDALQQIIHEAELGHRGLLPRHPYVAILKLRLAESLLGAGRNANAQTAAGEAAAILEPCGLGASRSAADALRINGLAAARLGNHEQAERQFDRAMKLLQPSDKVDSAPLATPELAELLAAQGELAADLHNDTEAADDYHQAVDQLDRMFDAKAADHPLRAEYLRALGKLTTKHTKEAK